MRNEKNRGNRISIDWYFYLAAYEITPHQIKFIVMCMSIRFSFDFFFLSLFIDGTTVDCHIQVLSSAMFVACITTNIRTNWSKRFGKFKQRNNISNGYTWCGYIKNFSNSLSKWRGDTQRYGFISCTIARYILFFSPFLSIWIWEQ